MASRAPDFARTISIVGHPMVLVPLAIALAMRGRVGVGQGVAILGAVLGAMVIVGAYLVHGVRTGRFSHIDVSRREERGTFYAVAMASTAAATALLYVTSAPRGAVFGVGCAFALLAVGSVVNRWVKASLHTAFAIVAAGIVGVGAPLAFAILLAIAAAVAWSRIALGRHTAREVLVGGVLGAIAAIALGWARANV
jgi:membrane-associated phospholipid phosphatase